MKIQTTSVCLYVLLGVILGNSGAVLAEEYTTPRAPENVLKMKNPVTLTSEALQEAANIYKSKCIKCHGTNGDGRGSATKGLAVKPRDYTDRSLMGKIPDGQLFWITVNGSDPDRTDMTGYKNKLTEEQVWELVHYIRSFAP
jgi:mono/diheme cytochrome c family protein